MKVLFAALLTLMLGCATLPAAAQDATGAMPATTTVTPAQKAELEKIIHDYLVEHPEVIKEAIMALQAKEEAGKTDAQNQAVSEHKDELYNDPSSPVVGNPMGDVTIVEFFDYHCPYCKAVAGPMDQLLQEDKGIRLVLKEFPILGEDSMLAARAALAAAEQGKYWAFHQALMAHRGTFDAGTLKAIAIKVGLDAAKLEAAMNDPKIAPMIDANHQLARSLDVGATPTFVIGGEVVEGAVPLERLKELVQKARGS